MIEQNKKWKNEKGMVLVTAMFLTMALVVVGSFTVMMTNAELDISSNDRLGKSAFYIADAGCSISTKVLNDTLHKWILKRDYEEDYEAKGIIFDPDLLLEKVKDYSVLTDSPSNGNGESNSDIEAAVSNGHLAMNLEWRARRAGAGSSILFAMGYEGVGVNRRHGGLKMYYDLNNKSTLNENTSTEINTVYLYKY